MVYICTRLYKYISVYININSHKTFTGVELRNSVYTRDTHRKDVWVL